MQAIFIYACMVAIDDNYLYVYKILHRAFLECIFHKFPGGACSQTTFMLWMLIMLYITTGL